MIIHYSTRLVLDYFNNQHWRYWYLVLYTHYEIEATQWFSNPSQKMAVACDSCLVYMKWLVFSCLFTMKTQDSARVFSTLYRKI